MTTEELSACLKACRQAAAEDDEVLPEFIRVEHIVSASDSAFSERTVREHIKRHGLSERVGNELFVLRDKLREGWPTVYRLLEKKMLAGREILRSHAA